MHDHEMQNILFCNKNIPILHIQPTPLKKALELAFVANPLKNYAVETFYVEYC